MKYKEYRTNVPAMSAKDINAYRSPSNRGPEASGVVRLPVSNDAGDGRTEAKVAPKKVLVNAKKNPTPPPPPPRPTPVAPWHPEGGSYEPPSGVSSDEAKWPNHASPEGGAWKSGFSWANDAEEKDLKVQKKLRRRERQKANREKGPSPRNIPQYDGGDERESVANADETMGDSEPHLDLDFGPTTLPFRGSREVEMTVPLPEPTVEETPPEPKPRGLMTPEERKANNAASRAAKRAKREAAKSQRPVEPAAATEPSEPQLPHAQSVLAAKIAKRHAQPEEGETPRGKKARKQDDVSEEIREKPSSKEKKRDKIRDSSAKKVKEPEVVKKPARGLEASVHAAPETGVKASQPNVETVVAPKGQQKKDKEPAKKSKSKDKDAATTSKASAKEGDKVPPRNKKDISKLEKELADGNSVWVNHPTLENPSPFHVAEAVVAGVAQCHPAGTDLTLVGCQSMGEKATLLRTSSEAVRRNFTDVKVNVVMTSKGLRHGLQVQAYKGGGNRHFHLERVGLPSAGNTALVVGCLKHHYPGMLFSLRRCARGTLLGEQFFVIFKEPPAKLVKDIAMEPDKRPQGRQAFMTPVRKHGRCQNDACNEMAHDGGVCPNTIKLTHPGLWDEIS